MKGAKKLKSIIAKNIKSIIRKRGLKQNAVGRLAGYDEKMFSNMLNGRKVIADIDVLNIANALGVTPNDLFGTDAS